LDLGSLFLLDEGLVDFGSNLPGLNELGDDEPFEFRKRHVPIKVTYLF
jgi:hypothetical protein